MPAWVLVLAAVMAAVYTVNCLVYLDGPLDMFIRIRDFAETHYPLFLGKLLNCPWCIGLWVGVFWAGALALVCGWPAWGVVFLGPAFAAISGLLLEDRIY